MLKTIKVHVLSAGDHVTFWWMDVHYIDHVEGQIFFFFLNSWCKVQHGIFHLTKIVPPALLPELNSYNKIDCWAIFDYQNLECAVVEHWGWACEPWQYLDFSEGGNCSGFPSVSKS